MTHNKPFGEQIDPDPLAMHNMDFILNSAAARQATAMLLDWTSHGKDSSGWSVRRVLFMRRPIEKHGGGLSWCCTVQYKVHDVHRPMGLGHFGPQLGHYESFRDWFGVIRGVITAIRVTMGHGSLWVMGYYGAWKYFLAFPIFGNKETRAKLPYFRTWESCRTMSLISGFSRGSPDSLGLAFRHCSIPRFTLFGSDNSNIMCAHFCHYSALTDTRTYSKKMHLLNTSRMLSREICAHWILLRHISVPFVSQCKLWTRMVIECFQCIVESMPRCINIVVRAKERWQSRGPARGRRYAVRRQAGGPLPHCVSPQPAHVANDFVSRSAAGASDTRWPGLRPCVATHPGSAQSSDHTMSGRVPNLHGNFLHEFVYEGHLARNAELEQVLFFSCEAMRVAILFVLDEPAVATFSHDFADGRIDRLADFKSAFHKHPGQHGLFPQAHPESFIEGYSIRAASEQNQNISGIYRFPRPFIPALLRSHLNTLIGSEVLDSSPRIADHPWRSRLVRHRSGEREVLGSNPGQCMGANLKSRRAASCRYNSTHPVWHALYECLQDIHGDSSPFLLQPFHELSNGFCPRLTSPHPPIQFVPNMLYRVDVGALGGPVQSANIVVGVSLYSSPWNMEPGIVILDVTRVHSVKTPQCWGHFTIQNVTIGLCVNATTDKHQRSYAEGRHVCSPVLTASYSGCNEGPVAPSWFETLSEIVSRIDTENCCTIRVQSWTGDRDKVHFEPLKLAIDESEIQIHEISLVQHFYIGRKNKLDCGSELGSFDLGSGAMLVQPGLSRCGVASHVERREQFAPGSMRRALGPDCEARDATWRYGQASVAFDLGSGAMLVQPASVVEEWRRM
ncbi:hypothetical protein PR048_027668 [Dryococelus australis]|uniref:Uncharacterized protein n=1 Tax=Dryococelus australis TaxID=614101 RepID=A0ABQ9GH40_9NEOP|nr:hypothetical protein PR048_027668 [Dryococelus australis]